MIKSVIVEGIPKIGRQSLFFNEDLNIITGKNGAGKTTLLKLIWYLISGNIEHAVAEIPFTYIELETSFYQLRIKRKDRRLDISIYIFDRNVTRSFADDENEEEEFIDGSAERANMIVIQYGGSVFLPTFRRIEGGYTLSPRRNLSIQRVRRNAVEEALLELSRRLSNEKHTFVASLSTSDIVDLVMRKYTEVSEKSNILQQQVSNQIIERIRKYEGVSHIGKREDIGEQSAVNAAENVITEIREAIENLDQERRNLLAPLEAIRTLVQTLFDHSGIQLNSRFSFGDAAEAVVSDQLSAGEKQMLSFICYNAFHNNYVFFIDEPELSLHVDWQRQLFPILQRQGTTNQFIVATHSPFIYSKYPDKEIMVDFDRGE